MEATSAKRHKTLPALELLGTASRLYDHMEHSKVDFEQVPVYSRFSKPFLEIFFLQDFRFFKKCENCGDLGINVIKIPESLQNSVLKC